ncbi:exosome complex component RRP40 [Diorhabda carinulata]|uniref:exosome complex component RRP40 n=1 Tax=Diorhabda carinulata TaxID=1163345 RepID=UPI0025A1935F|nr:exosome complex component RRP40 [Diorhabda carinulata]
MTQPEFVFPGEIIKEVKSLRGLTVLGPGLRQNEDPTNVLCVTQPGKLCFREPNVYWIEGNRTRYVPKKGDLVVGIVIKKAGATVKVDIGSAEHAALSLLCFEGATKKQKADVKVGDVVYAKLINAHKEMEPELVCIDSYFKAGPLGVLSSEGYCFTISLTLAQSLLDIENSMLKFLGEKFVYEIVVGVNGKVWINARKTTDILNLMKVLQIVDEHGITSVSEIRKFIL